MSVSQELDRWPSHWLAGSPQQSFIALLVSLSLVASAAKAIRQHLGHQVLPYHEIVSSRDEASSRLSVAGRFDPIQFDINRCRWQELCLFPGISRKLAGRIVEVREEMGGFRDFRELKHVAGIGDKKIEALRRHAQLMIGPG